MTTGHERDTETGLDYRGARFYDSDVARFLSLDPLAAEFAEWSAYNYVLGNPVMFVDPDGRSASSPIFGTDGKLLGTDSEGWTGEAIVMDEGKFTQGMDHTQASNTGTELSKYGEGISISDKSWKTVKDNGGTEMTPFLSNNSSSTVYYKPEGLNKEGIDQNPGKSSSEAYPIEAGKDLYAPIDGVATTKYNDHVLKIPTGATITITSEGGGDIDWNGFGGIGRVFAKIGWINKGYIETNYPDNTDWNALFNKASEIGKKEYWSW